jgi:hypothetical protein
MTKEYVQAIGRMAYVWGYALVNSHNRRAGFAYVTSQNGNVPGWNGGTLPMAPVGYNSMLNDYIKPEQTFVACPNQDVAYGAGYFALDKDPNCRAAALEPVGVGSLFVAGCCGDEGTLSLPEQEG